MTPNRKIVQSFTLIEMLLVIVVIAILAALVLRAGHYVRTRAAVAQCKAELAVLSSAIQEHYKATKQYPSPTGMFDALVSGPSKIEWPAERIANNQFLDPWGTPYAYSLHVDYRPLGVFDYRYFDLYSCGPDRLRNSVDDIYVDAASRN